MRGEEKWERERKNLLERKDCEKKSEREEERGRNTYGEKDKTLLLLI